MSDILTARILNCVFPGNNQSYAYFTDDAEIKAGDLVVVVVPNNRGGDAHPVFASPAPRAPLAVEAPAAFDEEGEVRTVEEIAAPPSWGPAASVAPVWASAPPPPPCGLGFAKIVRVVSSVETVDSVENVKEWIVGRLDFVEYAGRREREERRKVLVSKIKRARQEALESLELSELATKSPALASLLDEMRSL